MLIFSLQEQQAGAHMSQLRKLRPEVVCWHHRLGFKPSGFLLLHLLKASTYHILKLPAVYGS